MPPHADRLIALTRPVSASIRHCELTHQERVPIDLDRARDQHAAYERVLEDLGLDVVRLERADDLPDAVFVEDTAIVLDECAILARPGAASRRPELTGVASALARYRSLHAIEPPGTLDGGDVLCAGKTVFVGVSSRTNHAAISQLGAILRPWGYEVVPVEFQGCLHLKSAATLVDEETLLINPAWVNRSALPGMSFLDVDPSEPAAANALAVQGTILFPRHQPRTRARLEAAGLPTVPVDLSELAKAEGALTCCSLILRA